MASVNYDMETVSISDKNKSTKVPFYCGERLNSLATELALLAHDPSRLQRSYIYLLEGYDLETKNDRNY